MYRALSVALVLCFTPFTLAQYGLIKVDINQINFADLMNPNSGGGVVKGGIGKGVGGKGVGIKQKDPLAQADGAVWIYGFFELSAPTIDKQLKKFQPDGDKGGTYLRIDHRRWGKDAWVWVPVLDNIMTKYLDKKRLSDEFVTRPSKDPDDKLRLAYWALTHGLTRNFDNTMADLKKVAPDRPASQNYARLKADFKKPPTPEMPFDEATELKAQGYRPIDSPEGHYRIYYKGELNRPGGELSDISLKWRLGRMEETFNNFYYWFALQEGVPQPTLPAYRLPVIVDTSNDLSKRLKEWGVPPHGDGFTLRHEGLVLLTIRPTGDVYQYLEKNTNPIRLALGLQMDDMLKGVSPQKNLTNVTMVQTLSVLQKIMEDELETLAINQECTRQLLGASGFLSRNVATPEWIQRGLVSFFETPPASLHPNFGLARSNYLETLRNVHKTLKPGKNGPKSGDVLLNLVSDNYFRLAANDLRILRELDKKGLDAKDRKVLQDKAKESRDIAEATSWSLVYYLSVQRKVHFLSRYAEQLNRLPRNAIVTPQTLQYCFAQAFDLADAKDSTRLDSAKLQTFADGWLNYMVNNVFVESSELEMFINAPPAPAPSK